MRPPGGRLDGQDAAQTASSGGSGSTSERWLSCTATAVSPIERALKGVQGFPSGFGVDIRQV